MNRGDRDSTLSLKRHEGAIQRWEESELGHMLCAPVEDTELFPATFLRKSWGKKSHLAHLSKQLTSCILSLHLESSGSLELSLTCVSSSVTSKFSLFRCLFTNVMRVYKRIEMETFTCDGALGPGEEA